MERIQLVYHVVWVTKYRRKILNPGMVDCLQSLMPKLARSMSGVIVEQMGFDRDHVHFPKYAVADIMGELKSRSASILRKKFDFLKKVYWPENVVWSPGYFVSNVGIDEAIIKCYIEWQGRQDFRPAPHGAVRSLAATLGPRGLPVGFYLKIEIK